MAQNELVKKLLEKEGYKVNILTVSTKGDRDRKSSVTDRKRRTSRSTVSKTCLTRWRRGYASRECRTRQIPGTA